MARNFENFIDAYVEYANNKHAPKLFHLWAGISMIAASLERKVCFPQDDMFAYFPNLYIFLVSHPGVGKSSALNRSLDLLRELNRTCGGKVHIMPNQFTEAALVGGMKRATQAYNIGSHIIKHTSGYFCASEGSNSLKEVKGDIIPPLTQFYDCESMFTKETESKGKEEIPNVCLNMIAACTYDVMNRLLGNDQIMGGFASRITYVTYSEKLTQEEIEAKIDFADYEDEATINERARLRRLLLEDLSQINKLMGEFRREPDAKAAYREWYVKYELERQEHPSERMQSLLIRKPTIVNKLAMTMSVCESNDLVVKLSHWERALKLMADVEVSLPTMLRDARSRDVKSQSGLNNCIFKYFAMPVHHTTQGLYREVGRHGFDPQLIRNTVSMMSDSGDIRTESGHIILMADPDAHL